MQQDLAETIALQALGWIVAQPEELGGFLGATGAAPGDLAARAAEPAFLAAVLEYLLAEDRRVIAFCDASGIAYDRPMQASAALAGRAATHWT